MTTLNLIGQQLDEYRIERLLGQGGMARVYLATDIRLQRRAAIKVIDWSYQHNADYAARFEREAQAVAQLEHPHIVQVYRLGKAHGIFYMAMQYVDGSDLHSLLTRYRQSKEYLEPSQISRISHEICDALDYAHSQGVIHRDVKPSNILLDRAGKAYLADFGLVRVSSVATQGKILGSPHYMAPEQGVSSASVLPQSDLYSYGATLYEMLTGQPPFDGPNPTDVALMHLTEHPRPPSKLRAAIKPTLDEIILTTLAKEPADRYPDGKTLVRKLDQALKDSFPNMTKRGRAARAASPKLQQRLTEVSKPPLPPLPAVIAAPHAIDTAAPPPAAASPAPRRHSVMRRLFTYAFATVALVAIVLAGVLIFETYDTPENEPTQTTQNPTAASSPDGCPAFDQQHFATCTNGTGNSECWFTGEIVAEPNALLRSTPNTNTDTNVLGSLKRDTCVLVKGRTGNKQWLYVYSEALINRNVEIIAQHGWVSAALVEWEPLAGVDLVQELSIAGN